MNTVGALFAKFRCIRTGAASFAYKAKESEWEEEEKEAQEEEVIPQPFHMHSSSKFAELSQPVNDSWNVWAALLLLLHIKLLDKTKECVDYKLIYANIRYINLHLHR